MTLPYALCAVTHARRPISFVGAAPCSQRFSIRANTARSTNTTPTSPSSQTNGQMSPVRELATAATTPHEPSRSQALFSRAVATAINARVRRAVVSALLASVTGGEAAAKSGAIVAPPR